MLVTLSKIIQRQEIWAWISDYKDSVPFLWPQYFFCRIMCRVFVHHDLGFTGLLSMAANISTWWIFSLLKKKRSTNGNFVASLFRRIITMQLFTTWDSRRWTSIPHIFFIGSLFPCFSSSLLSLFQVRSRIIFHSSPPDDVVGHNSYETTRHQ